METFYGTQIIVPSQKSGVWEGCLNFLTLKTVCWIGICWQMGVMKFLVGWPV
jgi:hypothetical protein